MKQVGPTSGIVPLSVVAPTAGEGGQLVVEVGHVVATAEVTLNAPSFILAKRERDNDVGVLGRKKSKAPLSLRALRHVVGLTHPQLIEICAPTVTAPSCLASPRVVTTWFLWSLFVVNFILCVEDES